MKNWLTQLKNQKTVGTHATKPAKPRQEGFKVGFVGLVAQQFISCEKINQKNIPAPAQAVNDALIKVADADRWVWPHSTAMNTLEIEVFMARVVRLTDRWLCHDKAESVADKLVIRDREHDERRLCLECAGLIGTGPWRCRSWQAAQVPKDGLPRDFAMQLQRCLVFQPCKQEGLRKH